MAAEHVGGDMGSVVVDLLLYPQQAAPLAVSSVPNSAELLLIAASIYANPDLLPHDVVSRVASRLVEPRLGLPLRQQARNVLEFLLMTSHAQSVIDTVYDLLSQTTLNHDVFVELCEILKYAISFAPTTLRVETLISFAAAAHLHADRDLLWEGVIEPYLLLAGGSVDTHALRKLNAGYGEYPCIRYALYAFTQWKQYSEEVRAWAAARIGSCFSLHETTRRRLGGDGARILIVHNLIDGQGDEIVRCVFLMQAFLDFNSHLEIVVITRRLYLYAHPRVTVVSISDPAALDLVFEQTFDGIIDFYEEIVEELNLNTPLDRRILDYVVEHRPFLFAKSTMGFHRFTFERFDVDGQPMAERLGLHKQRIRNVYETASRMIAELGLPLHAGEDEPISELVLAGLPWPEARACWQKLIEPNSAGRPVALVNPFGGAKPTKGFIPQTFDSAAAEIDGLIADGYFIVLVPNGTPWGTAIQARNIIVQLDPERRSLVAIAADPSGTEPVIEGIPGQQPLEHRDAVMRQFLYFIGFADLIVTVEGWMMHAAWCLGRPYRLWMAPHSHLDEWHPWLRTPRQVVIPMLRWAGGLDQASPPPILEQPRKFLLQFLLREFGDAPDRKALPLLRKAVTSPDPELRRYGAQALTQFFDVSVTGELHALLRDPSCEVRGAAAEGLLKRADTLFSQSELLAHAYIGRSETDWASVIRLGEAARPALEIACCDEDPIVQREAKNALQHVAFQSRFRAFDEFHSRLRAPRTASQSQFRFFDLVRNLISPGRAALPDETRSRGTVLILTPVKNAARHLDQYFDNIAALSYPHSKISLGFLESDSSDDSLDRLATRLPTLRNQFRSAGLWKKDFGYQAPSGIHRGADLIQPQRRIVLAKSRNHLLMHALDDEEWVLWLDADVVEYPPDIIEHLLATGKRVVQPHCVLDYGGPTFDTNGWREQGSQHLDDLRGEGELVKLDAVGGAMLLVHGDVHRDGLIFPPFAYGRPSSLMRSGAGEVETEGLGILAHDMGHQCWGMPRLEIRHGRW